MVAINKADGDNRTRAELAAADYRGALHLMRPASPTWTPPVVVCSGLADEGLDDLWEQILVHRAKLDATGELEGRRRGQQVRWMWSMLDDRLRDDLRSLDTVTERIAALEDQVRHGEVTATMAVDEVWDLYVRSR
jgi:LAO/AO transport system kinase